MVSPSGSTQPSLSIEPQCPPAPTPAFSKERFITPAPRRGGETDLEPLWLSLPLSQPLFLSPGSAFLWTQWRRLWSHDSSLMAVHPCFRRVCVCACLCTVCTECRHECAFKWFPSNVLTVMEWFVSHSFTYQLLSSWTHRQAAPGWVTVLGTKGNKECCWEMSHLGRKRERGVWVVTGRMDHGSCSWNMCGCGVRVMARRVPVSTGFTP